MSEHVPGPRSLLVSTGLDPRASAPLSTLEALLPSATSSGTSITSYVASLRGNAYDVLTSGCA